VIWRAIYRHEGRKVSSPPLPKAQAKRWLTAQEESLHRGEHIDPRSGEVLFGEWLDEWQATRAAVLKPSTLAAEKGRLKRHVRPAFEQVQVKQITPLRIRQWVSTLAAGRGDIRPIAPKTIRHCHALLFAVMADAVTEGLIARNPCVGTRLPEADRHEQVFLTEQQVDQLIGAVDEHWKPLVTLLAGTGMRWGEAVGLKVGRVQIPPGSLTIAETLNESDGVLRWGTPKTKASRRSLRLPGLVVDALIPLIVDRPASAPVFTTPSGELVRNRNFRDRVWLPAVKELGLSPRPRIHDLRHTHASILIAQNVPLVAISRRLGHTSISVTSDVYGHLLPSVEDGLVAALDRAMGPGADVPQEAPIAP
jgi:integrase